MNSLKRFSYGLVGIATLSLCSHVAAEELRMWKDTSGKFQIEAKLEGVDGDSIKLRRTNGAVISIPKAKLSEADHKYLAELAAHASQKPQTPATTPKPAAGELPIVFVKLKSSKETIRVCPGIVAKAMGDRSWIICSNIATGANNRNQQKLNDIPPDKLTVEIAVGERSVAGELVLFSRTGPLIVSAPAMEVPAPAKPAPIEQVKVNLPLRIVFVETRSENGDAISLSESKSKVSKLYHDIETFEVHPAVEIPATYAAETYVFTAENNLLGRVNSRVEMRALAGKETRTATVLLASKETDPTTPGVGSTALFPISGDRDGIIYQFSAALVDPAHRVTSVEATIRRAKSGRPNAVEPNDPEQTVALELLPRDQPPPKSIGAFIGGDIYKSRCQFKNLWLPDTHSFEIKLKVITSDGAKMELPPQTVSLERNVREEESRREFAHIPGIFGGAKGKPVVKEVAGGGLQITDDATRFTEQPVLKIAGKLTPRVINQPVQMVNESKSGTGQTFKAYPIVLPTGPQDEMLVPSPDGKYLFYIARDRTLHRLRLEGMIDEAEVALPDECTGLAWSRAGLVAAAGNVLVLDPQSLTLKQEIPVTGAYRLSASLQSDLAFALRRDRDSGQRTPLSFSGPELVMFDLTTGKLLQKLQQQYEVSPGNHVGFSVGKAPLEFESFKASDDGKYLLLSGGGGIRRIRVDRNELVQEEATHEGGNAHIGNQTNEKIRVSASYIAFRRIVKDRNYNPLISIARIDDLGKDIATPDAASGNSLSLDGSTGKAAFILATPRAVGGRPPNPAVIPENAAISLLDLKSKETTKIELPWRFFHGNLWLIPGSKRIVLYSQNIIVADLTVESTDAKE